ncbi:class I adenylate-forming enzyme family protein [Marinobacterium marinum]|uniref:AMP-binding protein n=1 Tax=Marinobacterium marinum TaxID=2756129 RepID=A0A7W2ABN7_9GAMM|nr:AMP-binding protein [Marinobacterium marinum]MBA4501672.1 AMP-binding protein [Marinobacterium marinum]
MNVANYLAVNARQHPERAAIYVGDDRVHTYASLDTKARHLGRLLLEQEGLAPGDRVALFLPNSAEYIELLCAIWYAGLVAVPINHKLTLPEVEYILSNCDARLLFAEDVPPNSLPESVRILSPCLSGRDLSQALPGHRFRDSRDAAWIFYTSGTTGKPKGATLSHLNLTTMATSYLLGVDNVSREHKLVHFAPMSHGSGLYIIPFLMAGAANLIPAPAKFTPEHFIHTVNAHDQLSMFLAPTMIRRILDYLGTHKAHLAVNHLSTIVYGGGPMYAKDLNEALDVFGYRLAQIYGQGESPMTITCLNREQHRSLNRYLQSEAETGAPLLSAGQPHAQVEVAIRAPSGELLGAGQTGEVCVRGDSVMSGYWGNEEASGNALVDGWLLTGDVGHLDENDHLYLTDRLKDVIISGGTNIYPREVEEVLLSCPGVQEVSVVGERHPDWGEIVVAFIVAEEALSATELDRFCLDHMARFKRPKQYHFLSELPKNAYGKILKTELRDRLQNLNPQ